MCHLLIRSLGQFWRRDNVFWGRQRNPGRLLGILETERRGDETDFWDQRGIYVLHANYRLVYVGQTGNQGLGPRLRQHLSDDLAGRWDAFSWFGIRYVKANGQLSAMPSLRNLTIRKILDHVEAIVIHSAEPPMNSQGGRFGDDVERYLQRRDPRLGPESPIEVLDQIQERLGRLENQST